MDYPIFTLYHWPPISICAQMLSHDNISLESCEHYQKRSFRNRMYVCGSNGIKSLSIPLKKGKNEQTNIQKVKISYDEDWCSPLLKTIRSFYGKAPYFEEIFDDIQQIYKKQETYLYQLNINILRWVVTFLQVDIKVHESSIYAPKPAANDFRDQPSIKSYDSLNIPPYTQLFSDRLPFQNNISILDLLFCQGPAALLYLRSINHDLS